MRGLTKQTFQIDGKELQKNQVMEMVCQLVAEGASLVDVVRKPGMPSLRAIASWRKNDGTFSELLEEAEEVRGIVLAERALRLSGTADKDTAPAVKLEVETHKWLAQKLNVRYADRQVIKHEHELTMKSDEELRNMVRAALVADAQLVNSLDAATLQTLGLRDANAMQVQDAEVVDG